MTDPHSSDPAWYAASALTEAGIPVSTGDRYGGEDPQALVNRVVQTLVQRAPSGWQSVHGAFSLAGDAAIAHVLASTPNGEVSIPVEANVVEQIRAHRRATVGPDGPWLRLLFDCDSNGTLRVGFDYGDVELPAEQLLPGDAYMVDFQRYPRSDAPVWMLAHMGNDGQQMRSAADAARAGAGGHVAAVDEDIPELGPLWSRFAVLAALCRGAGESSGVRIDPAFAAYLGEGGGSVLARLPGNRAVLSGGRDDSPLLSAAYKGVIGWPDLYRGAPVWLHNLYLDPRAAAGRLSFCYWWDGRQWYRADLAAAEPLRGADPPWSPVEEIARGVPGIWTAASTADQVGRIVERVGAFTDDTVDAAVALVRAAQGAAVSWADLQGLFPRGVPEVFDLAEAAAQLDAAGLFMWR